MEIILPCAGLSTRFPNLRPKYLLTDYSGKLMVENALKNFVNKHNITLIILDKHNKDFSAEKKLREAFGDQINIVILENPTSGPADTVYQGLIKGNIDRSASILIKDCDSFFDSKEIDGNAICVTSLTKNPNVRNAAAKSYVVTDEQNIITTVVEKKIVSDRFCVGGYQFEKASNFIDALNRTFRIEAKLAGLNDVKPNMVAKLSIVEYVNKKAIVVPANAVQRTESETYIMVAKQNKNNYVAEKRTIVIGKSNQELAEVKSGINIGETIIVNGFQELTDGQIIKPTNIK